MAERGFLNRGGLVIALVTGGVLVNGCAPKFNFRASLSSSDLSGGGPAYGPATQLVFTRQPYSETASESEIPVQVTIEDAEGRVVSGGIDSSAQISLSLTSGTGPLNGTTMLAASSGVADFTLSGVNISTLGSGDVIQAAKASTLGSGGTASMTNNSSSFDVVSGNAWLGATPSAEWLTTGGLPAAASGDGMFSAPTGTFVDSSGNLYVADSLNYRVTKFNSSGTYQGWVGWLRGQSPTGGASGCTTLGNDAVTPGWCTGGVGGGNGYISPSQIWGDGTYLYVTNNTTLGIADSVMRFNASTGAYMGWIGAYNGSAGDLSDTYTSDCSTLNGSSSDVATPGWCVGEEGTNIARASENGMFTAPSGIAGGGTYLYVADASGKVQRVTATTGAPAGWIGRVGTAGGGGCGTVGSFTTGWCTDATATPKSGSAADGSFSTGLDGNLYQGVYYYSGSIYVTDPFNYKINQYNASTGAFVGWIGMVATTPTGGGGTCTSTTAGNPTPGWCTGGSAQSGDGLAEFEGPYGLSGDGTDLYVSDSSGRILEYDLSSGAFVGWIGAIGSAGTGACGSAGSFTSGWCSATGSTPEVGTGDGMLSPYNNGFQSDEGIFYSSQSGGTLWVADMGNNRVSQYNASTGAFNGWIGADANVSLTWQTGASGLAAGGQAIDESFSQFLGGVLANGNSLWVEDGNRIKYFDTSAANPDYLGWTGQVLIPPTGGGASCTSLASEQFTPAWCTGGEAQFISNNDVDGSINDISLSSAGTPTGFATDGNYIYVADSSARVERFDLNGVFQGWIGVVDSATPTGGDPGCTGATSGEFTPGWCVGGSDSNGSAMGQFEWPTSIYSDGTYLYVSDFDTGRIQKFWASNGQFVAWIGLIASSPTGGELGCAGASVGSMTPGWCTGGNSDNTGFADPTGDGRLGSVSSITGDGTYLYAVLGQGSAIKRFNAATGAFAGWIGGIGTVGGTCTAGANQFTGGWCSGGTSTAAWTFYGSGAILGAESVYADGNYVYLLAGGGYGNSYVAKYVASTGAFVGWKGVVSTTPTGGDPGCTSAAAGTFTPGWCTGGLSYGYALGVTGALDLGLEITGEGSFLYIADTLNNRVVRYGK